MLNLKYYFYSILLLSSLTILSCHKHDDDDLSGTGTLEIEFDHKANGQTFAFGQDYVNESGETMQFTEFNYYVSNFYWLNLTEVFIQFQRMNVIF